MYFTVKILYFFCIFGIVQKISGKNTINFITFPDSQP